MILRLISNRCSYFILIYLIINPSYADFIKNIIVFGDSLSDNGNYYSYSQHKTPRSPLYYHGRFSNGLIWTDYLNIKYFSEIDKNHLINYAFGSATLEYDQQSIFTLTHEIDSYLLTHNDLQNNLYIIWVGANNYLTPEFNYVIPAHIVSLIQHDITRLIIAGATHILVLNLPDLGATPIAKIFMSQHKLSAKSMQHNRKLLFMLNALAKKYSTVQILHGDVAFVFKNIIKYPAKYGFSNVVDACYLNQKYINCNDYLFFDWMHPTTKAHKLMAYYVYKLLKIAKLYS